MRSEFKILERSPKGGGEAGRAQSCSGRDRMRLSVRARRVCEQVVIIGVTSFKSFKVGDVKSRALLIKI